MARIVNETSHGRVEIQIFPAMQLGSKKAMIEGLLLGTIDIVVTANGSATNFVPQLGVLDLPFLFRDRSYMYLDLLMWWEPTVTPWVLYSDRLRPS